MRGVVAGKLPPMTCLVCRKITPVQQHLHAHGGFWGLAPQLMASPRHAALLAALDADTWQRCTAKPHNAASLMHLLENHPVLAAVGSAVSADQRTAVAVEWDVWLDAAAPANLSKARVTHGGVLQTMMSLSGLQMLQRYAATSANVQMGPSVPTWLRLYSESLRQLTGRPHTFLPGAVFLDIKSAYSTSGDIAAFVAALANFGVSTLNAGSFNPAQFSGFAPPDTLIFFSGLRGITHALEHNTLPAHRGALFNGAALLCGNARGGWAIDGARLRRLQIAQLRRQTRLGVYIQEAAACPHATDLLIQCVNRHASTFALGFCYGNVSGWASEGVRGSGAGLQALADLTGAWLRWLRRVWAGI